MIIILITVLIVGFIAIYVTNTYIFYPISNKDIVVIKPIFTSSAYQPKGFYDYFKQKCSSECLTVKIYDALQYISSKNALEIFKWNKIKILTDIDIHNNPDILSQFKTVILLHNEYVTQNEFDSITSHPNVIYLYPNALYGKISYSNDTITLQRGHNYPESSILNGFDWELDNSKMEYDVKCKTWNFNKVKNGYMLNCYPEHIIKTNIDMIKKIDKLTHN